MSVHLLLDEIGDRVACPRIFEARSFRVTPIFILIFVILAIPSPPTGLMDGSPMFRQEDAKNSPEARALAFLAREVPHWSERNRCFSCHNNGDAARALFRAKRQSYAIGEQSLRSTLVWLAQPRKWDDNKGDPRFSDKVLARIQFASALSDAVEAKLIEGRDALLEAASMLAADQQKNGSWKIDASGTIGSPATYGTCLATVTTRNVLQKSDASRFKAEIERADAWLRGMRVGNILDTAALLLGTDPNTGDEDLRALSKSCLERLLAGQTRDGGWGPFLKTAPETFDTAVVLLALVPHSKNPLTRSAVRRGRAFLIQAQFEDGSWMETTRPAGGVSYAQRISTSAWATLALLATQFR